MDIQSVIVSIDELNKTKTAIANAIRTKGVSSVGRFSLFPDEIKSIQGGSTGAAYKRIIDNISQYNIVKKGNNNELTAIGSVSETFEDVKTNNVTIYSVYGIENIKIEDGAYKNRIKQQSKSGYYNLKLGDYNCGGINYNTLTLSISPIASSNVNGTVSIKYTTAGTEHTVTMPIKDNPIVQHHDDIYWLMQYKFDPATERKDLKQFTNMKDAEEGYAIFDGGTSSLMWSETRPAIFDTLNNLNGGQGIDALLVLRENNQLLESIPVKLVKSIQTKRIPIAPNENAAVLEVENDKLVFHYSDTDTRLNAKCIVATKEWTTTTDASILDKVKKLNDVTYGLVGIAVSENGRPVSYEDAQAAGML
jgi:hypothetical protein